MRLFLAVAVLMLAFVAYTEAQDDSVADKFKNFGEQVSGVATNVAEQIKTSFQDINNSETAAKVKTWWTEQLERMRNSFQ